MRYINYRKITSFSGGDFINRPPFPWESIQGVLTDEGYKILCENIPDLELFEKDFGSTRKFGEKPHNRFRLWYEKMDNSRLPLPWRDFIAELNAKEYREFIKSLFGIEKFALRLEWHRTPAGEVVHPHLDGYTTYGAHLFYFNQLGEWKSEWGGETLILEGKRNFSITDHPDFEDFNIAGSASCVGNTSTIFMNSDHSWHGVREIKSDPGIYRNLFTVFISKPKISLLSRAYSKLKKLIRIVSPINFKK